jgi:hypothetical protein
VVNADKFSTSLCFQGPKSRCPLRSQYNSPEVSLLHGLGPIYLLVGIHKSVPKSIAAHSVNLL